MVLKNDQPGIPSNHGPIIPAGRVGSKAGKGRRPLFRAGPVCHRAQRGRVPTGDGSPPETRTQASLIGRQFSPAENTANCPIQTPTTKVPESDSEPRFWANTKDRPGQPRLLSGASIHSFHLPHPPMKSIGTEPHKAKSYPVYRTLV